MDSVFKGIRIIQYINMQKPIGISPFGLLVDNGKNYFGFNLFEPVCLLNINQVGGKFWHDVYLGYFFNNPLYS